MALDAGEEQEKTLLRSPWAADISPYCGSHVSAASVRLYFPISCDVQAGDELGRAACGRGRCAKSWVPLHVGHSHTGVRGWCARVRARVRGGGDLSSALACFSNVDIIISIIWMRCGNHMDQTALRKTSLSHFLFPARLSIRRCSSFCNMYILLVNITFPHLHLNDTGFLGIHP